MTSEYIRVHICVFPLFLPHKHVSSTCGYCCVFCSRRPSLLTCCHFHAPPLPAFLHPLSPPRAPPLSCAATLVRRPPLDSCRGCRYVLFRLFRSLKGIGTLRCRTSHGRGCHDPNDTAGPPGQGRPRTFEGVQGHSVRAGNMQFRIYIDVLNIDREIDWQCGHPHCNGQNKGRMLTGLFRKLGLEPR